ncbi:palmitoyltransferase ZDHHC3-like isoform X2 [Dysidea avara]|uniref:palmitoyltransferase ZDHHC3-like isoform X2 n=1 Tax=Dysidea avara TaxID=196820 RepID=UPI00332DC5AA
MVVCHTTPYGIIGVTAVYVLIAFADYTTVKFVIEMEDSNSRDAVKAFFYHLLALMAIIAHLRCMLSDPGYVPLPRTKLDFAELEAKSPVKDISEDAATIDDWTVCSKCETFRPPRAHHCRVCRRCVRRMDHHCPWVNNCVGEYNLKFFMLFLFYTGLLCMWSLLMVMTDWYYTWDEPMERVDMILTILLLFECIVFGLFIGAVGLGQICALFVFDRNAIEMRKFGLDFHTRPSKWRQITSVMGQGSMLLWFMPCVKANLLPQASQPDFAV